jgi:hypothetical protein
MEDLKMQKHPAARLYTHFSGDARRPYIEDHSLQLFYPESVEALFDVKQLYSSFKQKSSFVSSEYEESLQSIQSLEREFAALKAVAKDLEDAYQDVVKGN